MCEAMIGKSITSCFRFVTHCTSFRLVIHCIPMCLLELVKNLMLENGQEVSELKKQTLLDESIETCRKLAEDNKQGYFGKDDVLMISRMNDIIPWKKF